MSTQRARLTSRSIIVVAALALSACAGDGARRPSTLAAEATSDRIGAPQYGNDPMTILTLPVGAGNCQLLACPSQNKLIVFDCGSTGAGALGWSAQQVQQYVANLINPHTEVTVSVSHADADHSNFIPTVFGNVPVRSIVLGDTLNNYAVGFQQWAAAEIRNAGAQLYQWNGVYRSAAPEPPLTCFAPNGAVDVAGQIMVVNAGNTRNDKSLVVGTTYGQFQAVFTGDMTGATEAQIIDGNPVLLGATDFITGAHHGADTMGSNSPAWVAATAPNGIVYSSGTRHLHPRCTVVARYQPYLYNNAGAHVGDCGHNGAYQPIQPQTLWEFVTNNNGLVRIDARNDGSYAYQIGYAAVSAGKATPAPQAPAPIAKPD